MRRFRGFGARPGGESVATSATALGPECGRVARATPRASRATRRVDLYVGVGDTTVPMSRRFLTMPNQHECALASPAPPARAAPRNRTVSAVDFRRPTPRHVVAVVVTPCSTPRAAQRFSRPLAASIVVERHVSRSAFSQRRDTSPRCRLGVT